jgi:hypothetical protein
MAIVHSSATIRPTKRELLETVLGGSVEVLGSYRFDDPAGEVGSRRSLHDAENSSDTSCSPIAALHSRVTNHSW